MKTRHAAASLVSLPPVLVRGKTNLSRRSGALAAGLAALTLAVAGCGGDDDSDTTTAAAAAEVDFAALQECVEADGSVEVAAGATEVDSVAAEAGEGAFQVRWPNGDYANVAAETTSDDAAAAVEEYESGATILTEIESYGPVVAAYSIKPSAKESGLISGCAEQASQPE
jgi:hypothetical protein